MSRFFNIRQNRPKSLFHIGMISFFILYVALLSPSLSAKEDNTQASASVIKRALPIYPKYAINHKLEGSVLINFSIEKDGNVSDIEVVASDLDGLFDGNAVLAVQKWLYTQPKNKIRNNYVALEFALTDIPNISQFSHVERIQVRPN